MRKLKDSRCQVFNKQSVRIDETMNHLVLLNLDEMLDHKLTIVLVCFKYLHLQGLLPENKAGSMLLYLAKHISSSGDGLMVVLWWRFVQIYQLKRLVTAITLAKHLNVEEIPLILVPLNELESLLLKVMNRKMVTFHDDFAVSNDLKAFH